MIAPHYEKLAEQYSRPKKMAFAKINTDSQSTIAQTNSVTAMPTFKIFHNGTCVETIKGANPSALREAVDKAVKLVGSGGPPRDSFKTPGRTLGETNKGGSGRVFNMSNLLNVIMAAVGLYLASLFSASTQKRLNNE